jgi:hypothetical protein
MAEEKGVLYDEFVVGGLLDDAAVRVNTARWVQWDYKGKSPKPAFALCINATDTEGKVYDEYLSCGDLRFFVPSSDGRKAVQVGSQQKLNANTNAVAFLMSIMNADTRGQLAAKLKTSDDISVLDGLQCHVVRKAQPKRSGTNFIAAPGMEAQQQADKQYLSVEKILAYPGEPGPLSAVQSQAAPAATAAGSTPGNGAAAAPPAGGSTAGAATEEHAMGLMLNLLASNGGKMTKATIAGKAFTHPDMKAIPDAPTRNAVLSLLTKAEWLGSEGKPWSFDAASGTVSQ